jgi:starch phosphorylase
VRQRQEHGASEDLIEEARHAFDPNALTIGFARRFTAYKRPTLLLTDRNRLIRLLCDQQRPVQLIMAGKAHPHDEEGKRLVQALAQFAAQPIFRNRVVFLEDYEMTLAQELVAGIDVWLNTPRRLLEASGTSGMKVLVNGGLNLSELDGWWAEAYIPEVGWALGKNEPKVGGLSDAEEATQLYDLLEHQIIPEFYARDQEAIPRRWIERVRTSMSQLTPRYSSNRMVREYVENAYLPASSAYHLRAANGGQLAQDIHLWHQSIQAHWTTLRFGDMYVVQIEKDWSFEVQVHCGSLNPAMVSVELYADRHGDHPSNRIMLDLKNPVPGLVNAYLYSGNAPAIRPADHYTPRIVPAHPHAAVPLECSEIHWIR